MTEGQWLWMMIHMAVDSDEKMDNTCGECKSHADDKRCIACGKKMADESTINPEFDEELFNKLKSNS